MQIDIKSAFQIINEILKDIPSGSFESKELIKHFLSASDSDFIIGEKLVEEKQFKNLVEMAKKRKSGYPLQYIIGEWDFFGYKFKVGEGVLIPRYDTEVLIEVALEYADRLMKAQPLEKSNSNSFDIKILDLCSGSGCVAITLKKKLPLCEVYALEKSEKALHFLNENVMLNEVEISVLRDDALNPKTLESEFDIIVSNPPYLTGHDMKNLQDEVKFEPEMALYGEDDGLHFYKELTKQWSKRLKSGGLLAYEIGIGQYDDVHKILSENGYTNICNKRDLCDIIRVIYAIK